ncbi:MAG TPA: hypothetical protein DDW50_05980 [Firmicutes bacterium]|nr:hypothetical protein [Bacillota bacterium]
MSGGKGANQVVAITKLRVSVKMLGCVGIDGTVTYYLIPKVKMTSMFHELSVLKMFLPEFLY